MGDVLMNYCESLTSAMTWLGQQPATVFLGQSVVYKGNAMFNTLSGVPMEKRLELPVAEEMQMGISLGLALTGKVVISIYPRFDFLLLAMNQLVNHVDKLEEFTHDQYHTKVIIRVGVGAITPMYPGVQHCGDYTEGFSRILRMPVIRLESPTDVQLAYQVAYRGKGSFLMVENMEKYGMV